MAVWQNRTKCFFWRSKYTLLRLDAGRLPFETGSLAAIHAGIIHKMAMPLSFITGLKKGVFGFVISRKLDWGYKMYDTLATTLCKSLQIAVPHGRNTGFWHWPRTYK